ncbi:uncharacterized protein [Oscarella lobularis]|uniref:uncharacterized protein isoform X2 n=1 Tax=Oscarella lobularis TaxID=121494 RepID=UPI0033139DF5
MSRPYLYFALIFAVRTVSVVPPSFTHFPPRSVYFALGSPLDVNCSTKEPANISWHRFDSDSRLDPTKYGIYQETNRTSRLHLEGRALVKAFSDLLFTFICRATAFALSTDSKKFDFIPGKIPKFNVKPTNAVVQEETEVAFKCSILLSVPQSTISWTFSSQSLGGTSSISDSLGKKNITVIANRYNAGIYTCHLTNVLGTVTASASLTVYYSAEPKLVLDSPVKFGDNATLSCFSESVPLATSAHFYRENELISTSFTFTHLSRNASVILLVLRGMKESGNYSCKPIGNNSRSKPALLVVIENHLALPIQFTIVNKTASLICWQTNTVIISSTLMCTAKTADGCTGRFHNVTYVVSGENADTTYCAAASDLLPGLAYGCSVFAANNFSDESKSKEFNIISNIGPPGGVYLRESINQRTAVSISLSWCISYSGGNHLKVTVIGDGLIQSDIIYHHQSWLKGVATLTSLSPDTMYSVGIRVDYPGGNVKSKIRTLKTLYGNVRFTMNTTTTTTTTTATTATYVLEKSQRNLGFFIGVTSSALLFGTLVIAVAARCVCLRRKSTQTKNSAAAEKAAELSMNSSRAYAVIGDSKKPQMHPSSAYSVFTGK